MWLYREVADPTPNTIGKYEITGPLGRGSMGVVYKARDPEIGREVAIKTLRKVGAASFHSMDQALQRFRVEARSAGNLRHPNIITIYEVNRDGEIPYLVMDYVQGESLDGVIKSRDKLEPQLAFAYLRQAAQALDYAHEKGVVHRDIKPSNLLIDKRGTLYVLDFGIATISGSLAEQEDPATKSLVMGTPGYMSPEQILNQDIDYRSDIFSLAIVSFECLTGKRPFPGDNFTTVVSNILESAPISLTSLVPTLPLALEAEFEHAFCKKKEGRFQKAEEMIDAFVKACGLENKLAIVARTHGKREGSSSRKRRMTSEWQTVDGDPVTSSVTSSLNAVTSSGAVSEVTTSQGVSASQAAEFSTKPRSAAFKRPAGADVSAETSFINPYANTIEKKIIAVLGSFTAVVSVVFFLFVLTGGLEQGSLQTAGKILPVLEEKNIVPLDRIAAFKNQQSSNTPAEILEKAKNSQFEIEKRAAVLKLSELNARPELMSLSYTLAQSNSFSVRILAVESARRAENFKLLYQMLDDSDPLVRIYAVRALSQTQKVLQAESVRKLVLRLFQEDTPEVSQVITSVLKGVK